MPAFEWEELLYRVGKRSVGPVVGRDLLTVDAGTLLDARVAQRLAEALQLDPPGPDASVAHIAGLHLADRGDPEDIHFNVQRILDELSPPVPEPLGLLASMDDFDLYLAATPDDLLHRALRAARGGGNVHRLFFTLDGKGSLADFAKQLQRAYRAMVSATTR